MSERERIRKAAAELMRRRRATQSLHTFGMSVDIPTVVGEAPEPDETLCLAEYLYALHHRIIIHAIERTINRAFGRLLIQSPPGSAKSTYASVVLPPYVMGRKPKFKFILTSYASELAWVQSGRAMQIVEQEKYQQLAWQYSALLELEKKAQAHWSMNNGSECIAAGLLAGITGHRADGWVIDDPVAGQKEADSPGNRTDVWNAYKGDLLTRVKPEAWGILIQCMIGATVVRMADGSERALRDIRPGDSVATYDNGELAAAVVLRWVNQGADDVYEIRTESGRSLKANARHPFLIGTPEGRVWRRLSELTVGDALIATNPRSAGAYACRTITNDVGLLASGRPPLTRSHGARRISNTATALRKRITIICSKFRAAAARSVGGFLRTVSRRIGAANSASITTMKPATCAGCCAMIAISRSGPEQLPKFSKPQPTTCDFELDPIVSIAPAGREEVFDIQVDRTENFIANGAVSHNTRWHEDDLAGRILPEDYKGQSGIIRCRDGLDWEVLNIPAKATHADDPLGRQLGEYLWPEWFSPQHWAIFENGDARTWSSLYQQNPTPAGTGQFKKEMFNWYSPGELPPRLAKVGAGDYAVTKGGGDYTEYGIVGLDSDSNMWFLDWWFGQESSDVWIDGTLEMARRHGVKVWFNEGGVIDKSTRPAFNKAMRELKYFVDIRSLPSMADKVAKLQSFQARAGSGTVWMPKGVAWAERLVDLLCAFPAARYDDGPDVCGLLGRSIDQMQVGALPPEARKQGMRPFTAEWLEHEDKPDTTLRITL